MQKKMVHKKYIKRGNKVFGPYLYENYRVNGVTKTRYLGRGEKKKRDKNMRVNQYLKVLGFIFLVLFFIYLLLSFSSYVYNESDMGGELKSQKGFFDLFIFENVDFFSVSVNVALNSLPQIWDLEDEIYVCENTALSDHYFFVNDSDGDPINLSIDPHYADFFRLRPWGANSSQAFEGIEVEILTSGPFYKEDVNRKREPNQAYANYTEVIYATDGAYVVSNKTSVIVIEVNNLEIEDMGVQTVWTYGDDTNFEHIVDVDDPENAGHSFNISFTDSPLFNISSGGLMNFTANESFVPENQTSIVHNITVCVNDSGLKYSPHPKISEVCWNQGYYEDPLYRCDNFTLTITRRNRAPVITSYYPENLSLSAKARQILHFNVTSYDPDGTIPDTYWYVGNKLYKYSSGNSSSEFEYSFECEVGGVIPIIAEVTDGLLNTTKQWNISVIYEDCDDDGGGGGGGGGGIRYFFCEEDWSCGTWRQCSNLESAKNTREVGDYYYRLIKERCGFLNYDEDICGYQVRDCVDLNHCDTNKSILPTLKECYYTENPNCTDHIKNCHGGSCEILADCGGPCDPCPSCQDGIQNQNEEGVDCGGPCPICVERPEEPIFFKNLIAYSLILLLIIVIILIIYQARKYRVFGEKVREKKLEEKYLPRKIGIILIFFFIIIFIVFFNSFFFKLIFSDEIMIYHEEGALGSQSLFTGVMRNVAGLFLVDIIDVIVKSNGDTTLSVWDDTDNNGDKRYSYCNQYCVEKRKDASEWTVYFFANYTYQENPISSSGQCNIWFDDINWNSMTYNPGNGYWEYLRTFNDKGDFYYNLSCEAVDPANNLSIYTYATIFNTEPYVTKDAEGYIEGFLHCMEDIPCYYDFSLNVSEDDDNDELTYGYSDTSNTTLTNFTLGETGLLEVNVTKSAYTGDKKIELNVRDTDSPTISGLLEVYIDPINDPPLFVDLENQTFNMTELFHYDIGVIDEENNTPFLLNINFMDCFPAPWSDRIVSGDCELFNETGYYFNETSGEFYINFTPLKNDVGSYIINFSVMDNDSIYGNASSSKIINFTVLVINEAPVFTYVCDNERTAIEDTSFQCYINATDYEELFNLTFTSDTPWFLFDQIVPCSPSTDYKTSVSVDLNPGDVHVGNWSVEITVTDTGNPIKMNTTNIWFYIENLDDAVNFSYFDNQTCYPGTPYHLPVSARDDDLLIPVSTDPTVYSEDLQFSITYEDGSPVNWMSLNNKEVIDNMTYIYLDFLPEGSNVGVHILNLSVHDSNYYSYDSMLVSIDVDGNNPPKWIEPLQAGFNLNEDDHLYMDFSLNITDDDPGDVVSFSYKNFSYFKSFSISTNGLIDFTPPDEDVGNQLVEIRATDGKTPSPKNFTFIINNIDDSPYISSVEAINMSKDEIFSGDDITAEEDNIIDLSLFAVDDDLSIKQKSFYDEDLTINLTIIGPNPNLFTLYKTSVWRNNALYNSSFIPRKADVGSYKIIINISDKTDLSETFYFNLTIVPVQHSPVLMNFTNYTARINSNFYLDIDSIDLEDLNDSYGNLTYHYDFIEGNDFILGDESIFNTTSGEINVTFTSLGNYHINLTVEDSSGLNDTGDFWIFVYDNPVIEFPSFPCQFNLQENVTSNLIYQVNHTVGDNLSYGIYFDSQFKDNFSYYGNGTYLYYGFTPNFTDETYGGYNSLQLLVINPYFSDLKTTLSCDARIEHSNAPVVFSGWMGDKSTTYNNEIAIDLGDYFSDIDHNDSHYYQDVNFVVLSNASPSYIFTNFDPNTWVMRFSATDATKELINITGIDSEGANVTGNNFWMEFTPPTPVTKPKPSTGGGGGGGAVSTKIIYLKIITPGRVSAFQNEKIDIPITLLNNGDVSFGELSLSSHAFKDGSVSNSVQTSFDKNYLVSLAPEESQDFILSVLFNENNNVGDYEVLVNLTTQSPVYNDYAKIYINLQRINESKIEEVIVFTEEFIARNPQCIEIKELINEARKMYGEGDLAGARIKAEEALTACEESIYQVSVPRDRESAVSQSMFFFTLTVFVGIFLGILYYFYKRWRIQRAFNFQKERDKQKGVFNNSYKKV